MVREATEQWGFRQFAEMRFENGRAVLKTTSKEAARLRGGVYVATVDDRVLRVGLTSGPLRKRISSYRGGINRWFMYKGAKKSDTPPDEFRRWRAEIKRRRTVVFWGVATPQFKHAERWLICNFFPPLNAKKSLCECSEVPLTRYLTRFP